MANDRKAIVKFGHGIFGRASCYEELDKIQTPTLVIVGAEDPVQPLAQSPSELPIKFQGQPCVSSQIQPIYAR